MKRKTAHRMRELSRPAGERVPRYIPGDDDEGPILSSAGFVVVSVLGFLIVTVAAAWFGARQIETSLSRQATQALRSQGYSDVDVVAHGRDLDLVGTVAQAEWIVSAQRIAESVRGVRQVEVTLRVAEPPEEVGPVASDPLIVSWGEGTVTITGTLSRETTRRVFLDRLESRIEAPIDATGLIIRPDIAAEDDWLASVATLILTMTSEVDTGEIVVNSDEGIVIASAELETRQERADLRRDVDDIVASGTLQLVSALTIEDAPPPPPPEQVIELQGDLDDLIAGKVVEFELNSDRLTDVGRRLLDEVLDAMGEFPDVPVEIAGHTDAQGTDESNLDLSRRRAEAALAYFVANDADPDRFVVVGYGESQPIADNATEEGRARNRRIEFIALDE